MHNSGENKSNVQVHEDRTQISVGCSLPAMALLVLGYDSYLMGQPIPSWRNPIPPPRFFLPVFTAR